MAIPGSGAISLNQFHVEAGGSNNSQCSLNDSDIRGLIGKGSGATMSFNEWYGASAIVWSTTLTTGQTSNKSGTVTGFDRQVVGSLSDETVDFQNNRICLDLHHQSTGNKVVFRVEAGGGGNTGFTTMTVGSTTYQRTDASFFSGNSGQGLWEWSSGNPFSGTMNIVFT